jgi:branched-chain amino acid transport system substrate-binding protein
MSGTYYGDNIIKLVEKQVKDMGGILGGREMNVIKYDNRASVPEAQAGAGKLLFEDGVVALVWGGVSGAECQAVADFAEQNHILYTPFSSIIGLANMKYVLGAMPPIEVTCKGYIDLAINIAKAKTIGFLGAEISDARDRVKITKDAVEAAGIKVVYEDYVTPGTNDFLPYLTKLKYANPDVAILESSMGEFYQIIAKQIPDIGGLGDMKIGCLASAEAVISKPAANGWYLSTLWYPALDTPGSVKFVNDYKTMFGRMPSATDVYFYNSLWLSVAAVDKAGTTDREKIGQVGRSGQLEWEAPAGLSRWEADGLSNMPGFLVQMVDKQLVFAEKLER